MNVQGNRNCWLLQEEEEAAGNGLENGGSKAQEPKQAAAQAAASRKLGKDPTAATDFLPDREREAQEIAVREQLKKEYELRQRVLISTHALPALQMSVVCLGSLYWYHCIEGIR